MRQVVVTSQNGARLFEANSRDGGCLLFNSDLNNTVWLGKDPSITASYVNAIPLSPQSWIALDGEEDIYGVCQSGQSVTVNVIDGGQTFFQSGITSGSFRIGPQGLFIYGTQNPGTGTPPVFSATPPSSTKDPFGNPVIADAVTTYNAFGAALNILSMSKGGFFQYADLGNASQGLLILSILSVAGTDPFGNVTRVGVFGEDAFGNAINMIGSSISFFNGLIAQATGGRINIAGAGTPSVNPYIKVDAPEQTASGHMQMLLQGTSPDGTQPGQALIGQVTGNGVLTPQSNSMLEVQANVSGNNPVTQLIALAGGDPLIGGRVTADSQNRLRIDTSAPSSRVAIKAGPGGAVTQDSHITNPSAGAWAIDPLSAIVGGSAEVEHLFGFAGSWSQGASRPKCQYKMLAEANAIIIMGGFLVGAAVAGGQSMTTAVPVGYRPVNGQSIHMFDITGNLSLRGFFTGGGILQFSGPTTGVAIGDIIEVPAQIVYLNN